MNFVSSITLAFKDAFSSGFTEAKDNLAGMTSALEEINQNQSMNRLAADMAMMTSMTDPMRRALSEAMDQPARIAGSLDSAFRNIQVSTGATTEEMASMRRELLAIGGQAVAGPTAVANAFASVASGVADASKHMAIMSAAVSLAEANQTDLSKSTDAMVRVMNAWNLSADQAALAADILTQTTIMGVGSLDEFAGTIGQISMLASSAGIGLDELGASFAYVTNMGMSATQVKRQMRYIISSLVSPSESLAGLYESLGFESGQAMIQQYGLAESLAILKEAIGDEQAFASMIGNAEVATVALALTRDTYADFAASFVEGMSGITEAAQGVQLESIEMKMARLEGASQSLQAQIGQDINQIRGFFIDMQFGFLSNVVNPIMASPVGGAVSRIAAVTGLAAKTMLDMGSGALNAAAQMTTLAANINNAGGIANLFKSSVGLMGSGLKMLATPLRVVGSGMLGMGKSVIASLPALGGYIASMWASAAATLAATWPILAIIAGVAALAAGAFLLIRNWDRVSGFFVGLWDRIRGAFSAAWDWIRNIIFGASDWVLAAVAVFMPIVGIPALIIKHWDAITAFFGNLWNNLKAMIQGFIDWIGGKVEAFTAPFRAIGDVVSGVFGRVGGFISGLVGGGRNSGAALNDAFASGIQSNAGAPGDAFTASLQTVNRQMPHSDAPEGPLSQLTASGRALTDTFASGMDENVLRERANVVFSAAIPQGGTLEMADRESAMPQAGVSPTIHIQNLYVQADECQSLFDFIRMVMHSVERPKEAVV